MVREFNFTEKIWLYPGKAAWHFITLPRETAKEIDYYFSLQKRGWGSLKVEATIGHTTWETSIFPDKKSDSYVLPIKSEVRKREQLAAKKTVSVSLKIGN